jgi:hypothetical protein
MNNGRNAILSNRVIAFIHLTSRVFRDSWAHKYLPIRYPVSAPRIFLCLWFLYCWSLREIRTIAIESHTIFAYNFLRFSFFFFSFIKFTLCSSLHYRAYRDLYLMAGVRNEKSWLRQALSKPRFNGRPAVEKSLSQFREMAKFNKWAKGMVNALNIYAPRALL